MTEEHKTIRRDRRAAGKVIVDDRGNNVWDWNAKTGSHALDSTTILLQGLENEDLELAATHGIAVTGRLKQLRDEPSQPTAAVPRQPGAKRATAGESVFDMGEDDLYLRESTAAPASGTGTDVANGVELFELSIEQTVCSEPFDAGSSSFDPYNSANEER